MNTQVSISYFQSHPIQYISPLLKELARQMDVEVYYFFDTTKEGVADKEFGQVIKWDIPLLEGYRYTFIKNNSPWPGLSNRFYNLVNVGLVKCLRKDRSGIVIVNGWGYFSSILAIISARLMGKKVWVRGENPISQELGKRKVLLLIKSIFLKHLLFRFIHKFLYIGRENESFFRFYGVKLQQLVYTPYSVNNAYFNERYEQLKYRNEILRNQLQLPAGKRIILVSGKYIAKKRPMDIIRAFKTLSDLNVALVMVGEGEMRVEMEEFIRTNNLQDVYLTGFINQTKIPEYYMIADVFVMCSGAGETWGLSVNEAMNFAKPIVVTATCGCSADLVRNGENGFVVEEGNIVQLGDAIRKLLENDVFRHKAGQLSKQIINDYSIDSIVTNIKAATLN